MNSGRLKLIERTQIKLSSCVAIQVENFFPNESHEFINLSNVLLGIILTVNENS